jgi:adiponectin receptor
MSVRQRRSSATEVIGEAARNVEKKIGKALTVLWDDLPSWQQDNHYIHSGYRPQSFSFKKSFASLGYLHNESVNIYSHLVGAVLFSGVAAVLYTVIKPRYDSAATSDVLAFACFFVGAALCLGMSGTYHTISNHSPIVARFGNKLDYVGIVFLITGSFIPSIFYGFYCHPHLQEFYWTMVCCPSITHIRFNSLWDFRYAQSGSGVPVFPFLTVSELQLGVHIELACLF